MYTSKPKYFKGLAESRRSNGSNILRAHLGMKYIPRWLRNEGDRSTHRMESVNVRITCMLDFCSVDRKYNGVLNACFGTPCLTSLLCIIVGIEYGENKLSYENRRLPPGFTTLQSSCKLLFSFKTCINTPMHIAKSKTPSLNGSEDKLATFGVNRFCD